MDYTRKIFKGSALVTIGKIASIALTLFSTVLLARLLKPFDYGLLNLALSIMLFAYLFTNFGIGSSAVYHLPRGINEKKTIQLLAKWQGIIIVVVSTALFFTSGPIATFYKNTELGWILRILSIGLAFYTIFYFMQQVLQGFQKFKLFVLTDVIFSLSKYIPLLAVFLGFGLFGAVSGMVIAYTIAAFLALVLFFTKIKTRNEGAEPEPRKLIRYSSLIFIGFIFYTLYNLATNLIIGYFLPTDAVGFFTISWQAGCYSILTIPMALGIVLVPTISEMHLKKEDINESFRRISKYILYFVVPTGIGLIMLSERTISFIFGADYIFAAPLLSIMSFAFLLQGCAMAIEHLALGIGKPNIVTWKNAVQAVVNVILCIVLIPLIGVIGAGISFFVISLIGAFLINYWALKEYKFKYPFKSLAKSLVAALTMALVIKLLYFQFRFIPLVIIGTFVYFAVLALLKGFDRRDLQIMGIEKYWNKLTRKG